MKKLMTISALFILAMVMVYGAYRFGVRHGMDSVGGDLDVAGSPADEAMSAEDPSQWSTAELEEATRRHMADGISVGDIDPLTGRRVLHYFDPMMPASKFEAPGKSPYMDMMLVPAYEGTNSSDTSSVSINSRLQQNTGIRTTAVKRGSLSQQISAVGTIAWNEREEHVLQSRAPGFVEALHVRAALDSVEAGQPLVDLYVPEWVSAQEEFLALSRMEGEGLASLRDAARLRMRQAGMEEDQIREVARSGRVKSVFTLTAPVTGVVSELGIREGASVMAGDLLFRVNGTQSVWAYADVPESQAALLNAGDEVIASSPSLPGLNVTGSIQAMLAQVDPALRTRKARIELPNPDGKLAAGMLMQMRFNTMEREGALLVPTEALIRTGERTVVLVAEEEGSFHPQEVRTGLEVNGQSEIVQGLREGQSVVLSGQFLIDSEASLMGLEARLNAAEAQVGVPPAVHRAQARIEAIADDIVTLSHPAIASLNWPAMTMGFTLPEDPAMAQQLSVGAQVDVEFSITADGAAQIIMIEPVDAPGATP
jgi:Cu(I)/Ag(I) efflux system membrane fusion protein